ncbi:MAG: hypothetical protein KME31_07140 [Tolypothrix carrinoi HA7290-LM1]|nr:hypothetical protein [Tolypothrix carrinoi HA7290-LM1]
MGGWKDKGDKGDKGTRGTRRQGEFFHNTFLVSPSPPPPLPPLPLSPFPIPKIVDILFISIILEIWLKIIKTRLDMQIYLLHWGRNLVWK